MSLTLEVECPNCSAHLQIQGESGKSLQVKCARCSQTLAFTVPQVATDRATPVASKPSATPISLPPVSPQPAQRKNATVRNAPMRAQPVPVRPAQQVPLYHPSETQFRAAPQLPQPSPAINPLVVVAGIVSVGLVVFTIGVLYWMFKDGTDPKASISLPNVPMTTQTDAYTERVGTVPSVVPATESRQPSISTIAPSTAAASDAPPVALPALSPEKVIEEYFAILATARSTQNSTVDGRLQSLKKCDARAEILLRQAIALPYRPTELQRDFETRLEQWETKSPVSRIFDNAKSLDTNAELIWFRLLDRYMRAPLFGLSVADDELPITRYVQYVRALGNATTVMASIHGVESAEKAAVDLQESYEYVAQFLIDKVNLRVKEGTQIDHPISERVYQDLIIQLDGQISRRWSVGKNYRIAMDNLRFAIAERNDSLFTDIASLQKAIDGRPKLVLVSSGDVEGEVPSDKVDSISSDNPAKSQPSTEP